MADFKVGDRIEYIGNEIGGPKKGALGVIHFVGEGDYVAQMDDRIRYGHSAHNGMPGHCWWVASDEIRHYDSHREIKAHNTETALYYLELIDFQEKNDV